MLEAGFKRRLRPSRCACVHAPIIRRRQRDWVRDRGASWAASAIASKGTDYQSHVLRAMTLSNEKECDGSRNEGCNNQGHDYHDDHEHSLNDRQVYVTEPPRGRSSPE